MRQITPTLFYGEKSMPEAGGQAGSPCAWNLMRNEIAVILRHADEALQIARLGYFDLTGLNSARHPVGLRNLIEFSRAFYVVLQSMEAVDEKLFNSWHEEQQVMAKADAVLSFFAVLSDKILEQEQIPFFVSLSQKYSSAEIARLGRPPVGTSAFFIGDEHVGRGWIISFPADFEFRYFTELPQGIGQFEKSLCDSLLLENTALRDASLEELCSDYLNKLEDLLDYSRRAFIAELPPG